MSVWLTMRAPAQTSTLSQDAGLTEDLVAAREWVQNPARETKIEAFAPAADIRYREYTSPRPTRLWIAKIDLTYPGVRFAVTEPTDFTADSDPENDKFETGSATTLEFAENRGVQLAFNASAFAPMRARMGEPMDVVGLAASRGNAFSTADSRFGTLHIAKDGTVALKAPAEEKGELWHVATGFRMLRDNGQYVVDADVAKSGHGNLHPRTAVGTDKDGKVLWIVLVDGRQPNVSMGMTLAELAALFDSLGCWDALNLDGGGSSTLVMENDFGWHEVVNTPVGKKFPATLRQVAFNVGLYLPGAKISPTRGKPHNLREAVIQFASGKRGGGYELEADGVGTTIEYDGAPVLRASGNGTYCCGATLEAFLTGYRNLMYRDRRGEIPAKWFQDWSREKMLALKNGWYGTENAQTNAEIPQDVRETIREKQVYHMLPWTGLGTPLDDWRMLRRGDFLQFWRGKTGHSVMYWGRDFDDDGNERLWYWSSQGKPRYAYPQHPGGAPEKIAGYGINWEYIGKDIDPQRIYPVRLDDRVTSPIALKPHLVKDISSTARSADSAPVTSDFQQKRLFEMNEEEVAAVISNLQKTEPDVRKRIITLARRNIGQPYEIYLLGEYPFEMYDPDPLYCLSRSDCLTHAEHMYAMGFSSNWWDFLSKLQRIRYKDGEVGMVSRNHYTIADWNRNNAFMLEDITTKLDNGKAAIPLKQKLRRAPFLKKFGLGQDIPDEDITDDYIPNERVPNVVAELRDADFVNIIRGNPNSQYCGHTGLIAIGEDGTANFLHSARPTVREEPLVDYLASDPKSLGIKILRLRDDADTRFADAIENMPKGTKIDPQNLRAAMEKVYLPPASKLLDDERAVMHAQRLQALRLDDRATVDNALQAKLVAADAKIRAELEMEDADRAFGMVDLTDFRTAWLNPNEMFYGASVPKICILLGYFEQDPSRLESLKPEVQRELELMIKRSDNEMAAKYSQLVGLDFLQEMLTSDKYKFYDEKNGGGLWCGKHYGIDSPRVGEPLKDHSHAMTVRQVLRYYLLLEQGRLVSGKVCDKMRDIFSAPELQFHDKSFFEGLTGKDVTMIRKSGLWEDWHLDTARVQHGERVYLLAGATHHPKGQDYLAKMARAADEMLCGETKPPLPRHTTILFKNGADWATGKYGGNRSDWDSGDLMLLSSDPPKDHVYETEYLAPVIAPEFPFNEVLVSWNIRIDQRDFASIAIRAMCAAEDSVDSPDVLTSVLIDELGDVRLNNDGNRPNSVAGNVISRLENKDVDYFRSARSLTGSQFVIEAKHLAAKIVSPSVALVAITLSDTLGIPQATFGERKESENANRKDRLVFARDAIAGHQYVTKGGKHRASEACAVPSPLDTLLTTARREPRPPAKGGMATAGKEASRQVGTTGGRVENPPHKQNAHRGQSALDKKHERIKLDVPFFSQRTEKPEIAGRICSPTSVAMVMAYHGVTKPVAEVAAAAYDQAHDIY
ncbi:MAG: N-acetylmuramoyl-L-alanine amidase-like domain-containing protein, partial [Phycisphaerae bacterium]